MKDIDWSQTPLGPVDQWPQSLRTSIAIMLESLFAMVVAWGPEFRFFYNDPYRPVLGTKHPNALGKPGHEIFPEVWHAVGPEFERVRRGEAFATQDWLLPIERAGYLENVWFTLSYSPIRDESGAVGGVLAVVSETTDRVQSERGLATLRELARGSNDAKTLTCVCERATTIFADNPIDVPFSLAYVLDPNGHQARLVSTSNVAHGSKAAPLVIDLTSADADDANWPLKAAIESHELVVVGDLTQRFGVMPGGPDTEPAHKALVLPLNRAGSQVPYGVLIVGVSPRRALDDRYRGFFELAAEQVASAMATASAYEEERHRAEMLAELDRAKTAFFSNVSHEFRTPLTLMLGPLEDLLGGSRGQLPDVARDDIAATHRNALRLLKLVNTLLDFSRVEAGRARAAYEPVDLGALTVDLASVFRAAIERAGLHFTVNCQPLREPVYVDRAMWEKIVLNLLSNALKFTFTGEISVTLRAVGEFAELEVRDTGVGIPASEHEDVFKRFHRVQNVRARTHEGTGIGLALVRDLAILHGGDVQLASTPDVGSSFVVRIRRGTAHLPSSHVGASPSLASTAIRPDAYVEEALRWLPDVTPSADVPVANSGATATEREGRILVVDDNADMLAYISGLLRDRYDVMVARDGEDALRQMAVSLPDLVLTDVMMPRVDGFELLRALRDDERTRELPVILLSARAGEDSAVQGLARGADDYIVKPFAARELLARVQTHLGLARVRLSARREMQEMYDRVQDANETKMKFLAAMSHELRTPLNAILGYADLLTLGVRGKLADAQTNDVVRIQSAAHYLLGLINDILNFTRLEAGQVDLAIDRVPVHVLFERVHDLLAQPAAEKGIRFDFTAPAKSIAVNADPERVQQILLNLVTNAFKFTEAGGAVSIACDMSDETVNLHVRDTGCGIAEAQWSRIFEPFVQVERTRDRGGRHGVGLGLAISRDLARRMSGDITVTSALGGGSDFVLSLPRQIADQKTA